MAGNKKMMALLWIVGAVVLLLAVTLLVVPPVARGYLRRHDVELTGRKITFDGMRLNLLRGRADFTGLTIYEADGVTPFVKADELMADVGLARLMHGSIHIQKALLDGFDGTLVQNGAARNIDDLVERFSSGEDGGTGRTSVTLKNIRIRRSSFRYRDLAYGRKMEFTDLNLDVPKIRLSDDSRTSAGLKLTIADKGSARLKFDYDSRSKDFDADISLGDLDLSVVRPFVDSVLDVSRLKGTVKAFLKVRGNTDHLASLRISGDAGIDSFRADDPEREKALGFDSLRVRVRAVDLAAGRYSFSDLEAYGLEAAYLTDRDGRTNLDKILRRPAHSDTTAARTGSDDRASGSLLDGVSIENCTISGARLRYSDESLRTPFKCDIDDLSIVSRNLYSGGRTSLVAAASVNKARLEGEYDSQEGSSKYLKLKISNIDIRDFSPFCEEYTAYPLKDGVLTLTSETSISGSDLSSRNEIDAHGVKVGRRIRRIRTDSSIPLRAAVYALNDRDGHLHLTVPVTGDVASPKFHFSKALFKALGNVLTKVGVPSEDDEEGEAMTVGFDVSSSDLTTTQMHRLLKIRDQLAGQPGCKVHVVQYFHLSDTSESYKALSLQRAHMRSAVVADRLGISGDDVTVAPEEELLEYSGKPQFVVFAEQE